MREVVNGVMYVLSTGCQWRYIPKDLPPRSTVHDYFTRWNYDGTIEKIRKRCTSTLGNVRLAQGVCCGTQSHGISSSMRFCGQPFTRRVSRSVK